MGGGEDRTGAFGRLQSATPEACNRRGYGSAEADHFGTLYLRPERNEVPTVDLSPIITNTGGESLLRSFRLTPGEGKRR